MKHDVLRSIAHNIAHSLASGCGFLIGLYFTDVFSEVRDSAEGFLEVDFLTGVTTGAATSASFARAVEFYREALPDLCVSQGATADDFQTLRARYERNLRFTVTIIDRKGRRSITDYKDYSGERITMLDSFGRIRPASVRNSTD